MANSLFSFAKQVATGDGVENYSPPQKTKDLERILGIPRRPQPLDVPSAVLDMTPVFRKPGGTLKLWPAQSAALLEAHEQGGLLGALVVGGGKTLTSLLMPLAIDGIDRAVLLIPAQLRAQLKADIERYKQHFYLPMSKISVLTYEELSSAKQQSALADLQPQLIISDECHKLKNPGATRVKRFMRFMQASGAKFVGLSGTITQASLRDYQHLASLALGKYSPLPSSRYELQAWCAVLDADAQEKSDPGALRLFCEPEESPRSGFRRRLRDTPGFVATAHVEVGASLVLGVRKLSIPAEVQVFLKNFRETWKILDVAHEYDDESVDEDQAAGKAKQLALGFYYVWKWPKGKVDRDWLHARSAWRKELRARLRGLARAGEDSPALLARIAKASWAWQRGERPERPEPFWLAGSWPAWEAVKDRPEPDVEPVWISKFAVEDAVAWVQESAAPSIVWYWDRAVGAALSAAGLPTFGAGSDQEINDTKAKKIAASLHAHAQGKNLQRFERGLVVGVPAGGDAWEQLLGRCHRSGQLADEVRYDMYLHTEEFQNAFNKAWRESKYIEETRGQQQRLLYASWSAAD